MNAIRARFVLSVLFVLAFALPAFPEDTAKKSPVPDKNAQAEATKLIKEVYGDEYAKATTPDEKQALAKKLLGKAKETQDDPASKFVLLRLTKDIATQATDGETALQAIDAMAESFQIDAPEMKAAVLVKFGSYAKATAQHKAIAEQALTLMDEAIAEDNFTVAEQLGQLAVNEAQNASEKELISQAHGRIAEATEVAKAYKEAKAAKITLVTTPDDPQANMVVGKYLCFFKGDWDKGLPMLAIGTDEALKTLAGKETAGAASSSEQARLGDAWWTLAEEEEGTAKKQTQGRAGYWYRQALPGLSGIAKDKVEKRLKGIAPAAVKWPPGRFELLSQVDVARDHVSGEWWKDNKGLKCVLPGSCTRILLPMMVHGEYDLTVSFTRTGGDNCICTMLPVGSHICMVTLSTTRDKCHGIDLIEGQGADRNPTTIRPGALINGKKYDLLVKVRLHNQLASIEVLLDKVSIIRWHGKESSLSLPEDWRLPQMQRFGLGVYQSTALFHSVELKMISGKAEWVK